VAGIIGRNLFSEWHIVANDLFSLTKERKMMAKRKSALDCQAPRLIHLNEDRPAQHP
jgi:hypothetical protein